MIPSFRIQSRIQGTTADEINPALLIIRNMP